MKSKEKCSDFIIIDYCKNHDELIIILKNHLTKLIEPFLTLISSENISNRRY